MADPGPVAQTFFTDEEIGNYYLLDSIITLVDAKHAPKQLDEFHEAQEQVGFADRILLSKTDLTAEDETQQLIQRLKRMNPRAPIKKVHFGEAPIGEVLDIRGFNLNAILELDPEFLADTPSSFWISPADGFVVNLGRTCRQLAVFFNRMPDGGTPAYVRFLRLSCPCPGPARGPLRSSIFPFRREDRLHGTDHHRSDRRPG